MRIKLSDYDRLLIASAHRQVPWQGTEAVVTALYELGEALNLKGALKLAGTKKLEELSRTPTFDAKLSTEQSEILIALVAGGGQAVVGEMGPVLGELVVRLRKAFPRKPAADAK